ncbi:cell division protein FtsQ/DivIB [Legionella impletisoli]|uniref:Cell division protein FtsQ n=1 Tax=Legionella impletisoli TaxID=343510 RepID=A0A917NCD9_9GAMM|nr:cell division protein FtsQ/DivIB [Legionella impletisoli]GGI88673.1 cell division protein FtsQ [Legionella impletisoli]
MESSKGRLRYTGHLILLIICALLLSLRLLYLFLADSSRFPINTIKISATYQHISRAQLETILSNYSGASYFTLSTGALFQQLRALDWTDQVEIDRIWPDTLKITLIEKKPVAIWNNQLITAKGEFLGNDIALYSSSLPRLNGPENQQLDVLQNYQKLSKLLATNGLSASSLRLRENQAWDLTLTNGIKLRLGKRDLEQRLERFCRAYPAVFADKQEQLSSVDLRYARGMAVQWNQQTGR